MGNAVFSVQAIMTLQDLISGKLAAITSKLAAAGREAAAMGLKMAELAKAMLPVAAVAGLVLGGLGVATAKAADFEQAMSKVAAVAGGSAGDLAALRQNALQLGRDTMFSAMEAAGAQEDLAKAGLDTHQIIAAMPGVLNMAAAGDIGLSQAAEAATDTMKTFRMEASQIPIIGDVMAATANKTSTDIGLMVQSLKNSSAVAASVGVDLYDLSAMIGKMADQGIKGAEAGTQLRDMMLRIAAPNKKGAELMKELGIKTRDAKGNILPVLDVMEQLEKKLKPLGSGTRAQYIKEIFGDYAISATNALLSTGIAKVRQFSGELRNSAGSAAETAAIKMDNFKGAIKSLHGSIETLLINIGDPFLVPLTKLTQGLIKMVNILADLADTPAGRILSLLVGTMATAVVISTAVAAGMWAMAIAGPVVTAALAPLGAALGALGAPIWIVLAAVAALAVCWETDFGGMKTTLTEWWDKAVLVVKGVKAVFGSLTGSTGELKGQLARDIEAKGLLGLVTSVGKVVFRIRQFFVYLWDAFTSGTKDIGNIFAPLASAFDPIINALSPLFGWFKKLFNIGVDSKLSTWGAAGRLVGDLLGGAFRMIAFGIRMAMVPLQLFGALLGFVLSLFQGAHQGQAEAFKNSLANVFSSIGDSLRAAFPGVTAALAELWTSITGWFASLDPVGWITSASAGVGEAISAAFAQVTSLLSTIDLSAAGAAIIHTLVAGVTSAAGSLWGAVKGAFSGVTPLLTHSDAKEGPFSTLTASGRAIMTTLATGVTAAGPTLAGATSAAMAGAASTLTLDAPGLPDLTGTASWQTVPPPAISLPDSPQSQETSTRQATGAGRGRSGVTIQHLAVTLPDVTDGDGFVRSLQQLVEGYSA